MVSPSDDSSMSRTSLWLSLQWPPCLDLELFDCWGDQMIQHWLVCVQFPTIWEMRSHPDHHHYHCHEHLLCRESLLGRVLWVEVSDYDSYFDKIFCTVVKIFPLSCSQNISWNHWSERPSLRNWWVSERRHHLSIPTAWYSRPTPGNTVLWSVDEWSWDCSGVWDSVDLAQHWSQDLGHCDLNTGDKSLSQPHWCDH